MPELMIISLGDVPPHGIQLMAPAEMHRAKWMYKFLHSIEVWLFKNQF
jgi:hypothetical protein